MSNKIPVLVIFAPTATGKTELLFKLFGANGESAKPDSKIPKAKIINADSMQVYKGMDICTAKPSPAELQQLEHFLIDIKNPDEQFSAAEFVERADALCEQIHKQGFLPVVCGGTGFYIRSFLLGLPTTPEGNPKVRAELKEQAAKLGGQAMWERLAAVDPQSAQKINPADLYRILRALEIYQITGKTRDNFAAENVLRRHYDFTTIILERSRADLYNRIEERVDKMFQAGLQEEVNALMQKYSAEAPGMKAIGCQEFFGGGTTQEISARIKHNSKRYAKKQYVFMRGIPNAQIVKVEESGAYFEEVANIIAAATSHCLRP